LVPIVHKLEKLAGHSFELGLITEFIDGKAKLTLHQDDEKMIVPRSFIPAISLGDTRRLQLGNLARRVLKEFTLTHGSLYVMGKDTQQIATHGIPVKLHGKRRYSITFRHLYQKIPSLVDSRDSINKKRKQSHLTRKPDKKNKGSPTDTDKNVVGRVVEPDLPK